MSMNLPTPIPYGRLPHDSQQAGVIACAAVSWLVGAFLVCLRFYTRGRVLTVLGAADWCILVACLFSAGYTASTLEQVYRGLGRHIWDVDPAQIPLGVRASWYAILFYGLTVCMVKVSILLLYFTFFTVGRARWAARVVMGFVVVSNIWTMATVFTACIPLAAFWDFASRRAAGAAVWCQPAEVALFNNSLHVATDFVIFALPLPVVWGLRMPWRQKAALVALFALGFFVCIIAVVRLVIIFQSTRPSGGSQDLTWEAAALVCWTVVEINLAIACACIVTIKPLLIRRFPGFFGGARRRGSETTNPYSSPPTVGTRKTRTAADGGDAPRIESWIDFPGKLGLGVDSDDDDERDSVGAMTGGDANAVPCA